MAGFQFTPYQPDTRSILALMQAGPAARAAALRTSGEAQARAMEIGGQARAQAAQSIGQNISGSIGDILKQREEAPYRAAQMANLQAQADERKATAEARTQAGIDQRTIDRVLQESGDPETIVDSLRRSGNAHLIPQVQKSFDDAAARKAAYDKTLADTAKSTADAAETQQKIATAHADYLGGISADIAAHHYDPTAFFHGVALAHNDGMIDRVTAGKAIALGIQSPDQIKAFVDARIAASPEQRKLAAEQAKPKSPPPNPTEASLAMAAQSPDPTIAGPAKAALATMRAQHPPAASGTASTDAENAAAIADAIANGEQPPVTTGLFRLAGPVRAALAKKGYNLAGANLDWQATQKHVATLNGAKFTALQSSIATAYDSLDVIQSLADKWKGGRFPILNKANLLAAKNGAYGKEAASIATQLDGQITDVTSELGQVYMGGNSPTDHALSLAEKNLKGEWDQKVLTDMIALARTNLQIRKNSVTHSTPAGASAGNPYAAPAPAGIADPMGILGGAR